MFFNYNFYKYLFEISKLFIIYFEITKNKTISMKNLIDEL